MEDYTSPSHWGPHYWYVMRCTAFNYPDNPNSNDIKNAKTLYLLLKDILPCPMCRTNYAQHITKIPIESYLSSKAKLMEWVELIYQETEKVIRKSSTVQKPVQKPVQKNNQKPVDSAKQQLKPQLKPKQKIKQQIKQETNTSAVVHKQSKSSNIVRIKSIKNINMMLKQKINNASHSSAEEVKPFKKVSIKNKILNGATNKRLINVDSGRNVRSQNVGLNQPIIRIKAGAMTPVHINNKGNAPVLSNEIKYSGDAKVKKCNCGKKKKSGR